MSNNQKLRQSEIKGPGLTALIVAQTKEKVEIKEFFFQALKWTAQRTPKDMAHLSVTCAEADSISDASISLVDSKR